MKKKALSVGLGVLIVLAFGAKNVSAEIIRVSGPNPSNPLIIQQAIDGAKSGDIVSVGPGTYSLTAFISMKAGVSLVGDRAKDCTLEMTIQGPVIKCVGTGTPSNFTNTTIIEGFTIRHPVTPLTYGRGIECNNASPTIRNNIITGNTALYGGGGISCSNNSSPDINNNTIISNSAYSEVGGGGISCEGFLSSQIVIVNNTITDNNTVSRGGGISCYKTSSPLGINIIIANNVIAENSAAAGGGISCDTSILTNIINNTITQNEASGFYSGGGIFCWESSSYIANNIIAENNTTGYRQGGGIYIYSKNSSLTIDYNDVFANTYNDIPSTNPYDYDYVGCTKGSNDISIDPKFVNSNPDVGEDYDYHLQQNSLCIDSGYNYYVDGQAGLKLDFDLDGRPRIVNGAGVGIFVDMGAYEYSLTITASADSGGTISPSGIIFVNSGNSYGFNITHATGYGIADVKVDGNSVGAVSSFIFSNISASHTIEASFVKTYTIMATAGPGGSISPSGAVSVNHGANQAFTITANSGYMISDVVVNGSSVGAVSTYPFTNVTSAHTILATFALMPYTINASVSGGNGTVNPATQIVNSDLSATINITPNTGYHIASITDNGQSKPIANPYTISNVKENHNVVVTFATGAVTVQLKDSNGNPLSGGVVQYYSGGWQAFGTTDASGQVSKELLPLTYTFSMTYGFARQEKSQNIATNPTVVFQTKLVTVELRNSASSLIDTGTVQYYSGGWRDIGATSGGQVTKELLPLTYTFSMTYGFARQEKSQNVASNPTVVFQTTKVTVELRDSTNSLIDPGTVQYYSGGWRDIGATSGGQVTKELLPLTYTFSMTYGFARQEKSQNIATNPTVAFQTKLVTVELQNSANSLIDTGTVQYYSGGWRDIGATSGGQVTKELLPLTYTFSMTYGFARQEKSQNVATNPTVVFQTTRVTIQLKDSTGTLMDTGTVQYYSGGWRDIGATSGGQVTKELLPLTYTFSMTYGFARQEKSQNAASNPTVVFQTGKVHSDSGSCTHYYAGGWRTFTQDMELLPVTYTFHFNDGTPDGSYAIVAGTINHIH